MKVAGCLLLVSGAGIVLATLVLLPGLGMRSAFVAAGAVVELIGLGALARGHMLGERAASRAGANGQMRGAR